MNLENDILLHIEEYAGLCFLPREIALVLELEVSEFIDEFQKNNSEIKRAYDKGSLKYEALVRKSIFELAKSGSSSAQQDYLKLMKKRETELIKNYNG